MFGRHFSLARHLAPSTTRELRKWSREGLIKPVHATRQIDDIAADVLAVVRKHIVGEEVA